MLKQLKISTIATTLVLFTLFLGALNHKELFSIYYWDMIPVRVLSVLLIMLGVFVWFRYFRFKVNDTLFYLYLFLVFIITLSSFNGESLVKSFFYAAFFLVLPFSYLLTRFLLQNTQKFVIYFINIYLLTAFFSCLVVVAQIFYFYTTGNLFGAVWPVLDNVPRFGALFWDINHFGMFLAIALWFVLYKFIVTKKPFKKILIIFIGLVFLISLLLTASRSALLGLGVSSLVSLLIYFYYSDLSYKKSINYFAKWTIAVSPFLAFLGIFITKDFIRAFFFYRIHSFFTHFILLKIGFNLFTVKPFLGVGVGNFDSALRDSKFFSDFSLLDPSALNYKVPIHSVWFQFLAESGVFAFLTFASISLFTLFVLFFSYKQSKKVLYLVLFGSLLSMLVSGIFYSYNLEFYWITFTFISAVGFSYYNFSFKNIKKLVTSKVLGITLTTIGLAVFLQLIVFKNLDVAPSLSEIIVFNKAKELSNNAGVGTLYFWLLNDFQYMFGYFAYVGRLLSFLFVIVSFFLFSFSFNTFLKNKAQSAILSFGLILLLMPFLNIFSITPNSFYLYLFSLFIFFLTFLFSIFSNYKSTELNKYFVYTFLLVSLVVGFYFSTKSFSYNKNLSDLTKKVAQKYSISTLSIRVSEDVFKKRGAIDFYLEPKTSIVLLSNSSLEDKKALVITSKEYDNSSYARVLKKGKYKAYIYYDKEY